MEAPCRGGKPSGLPRRSDLADGANGFRDGRAESNVRYGLPEQLAETATRRPRNGRNVDLHTRAAGCRANSSDCPRARRYTLTLTSRLAGRLSWGAHPFRHGAEEAPLDSRPVGARLVSAVGDLALALDDAADCVSFLADALQHRLCLLEFRRWNYQQHSQAHVERPQHLVLGYVPELL
jgi:hypothetical protein